MDPDRWRQIKAIYLEARAHPKSHHNAFLVNACAGDPELTAEVQALLDQPASTDNFLDLLGGPEVALVAACAADAVPSLQPGQQLGAYQVLGRLGAGAMGEVYHARDLKLHRDVALKMLPRAVIADPDRLVRFEREARVLASLNHPNIASIHGLDESDGPALVLELVDGETLEERLARGRLAVAPAIDIARQIAGALDAAHSKGIIHCDLKPGNIKITPDGVVKVLDFGIARVATDASLARTAPTAADAAPRGTLTRSICGTPAYMSPEQEAGEPVDKRTDIWAFGCVLYEMLAGRRAFAGAEPVDRRDGRGTREPDFSALPNETPAAVRRLLRRCLEPDPKRRLRDIADAWIELDEMPDVVAAAVERHDATARLKAPRLTAIATILVLLVGVVVALSRVWPSTPERPTRQFVVLPPEGTAFTGSIYAPVFAVSPDGQRLAFVAGDVTDRGALWVRHLDSLNAERLVGTDGALVPFWSPDGSHIAFFAEGKLKKISLNGGAPATLADIPSTGIPGGGTWSRRGVIVFAPNANGRLFRVSDGGGLPVPLTDLGPGDAGHVWPQFLPDGQHFLYLVRAAPARRGIYVGSIDSPVEKRILPARDKALYAPPGYVLFLRDGSLMAQRFDAASHQLSGDPVALADSVISLSPEGRGLYDVSHTGTLVYRAAGPLPKRRPTWLDRSGKTVATIGEPAAYHVIRVSPDGSRLAAELHDPAGTGDLWIIDLARNSTTRFTFDGMHNTSPVWSPDGTRIVFTGRPDGNSNLHLKLLAADADEPLLVSDLEKRPTDWSPDGRHILYEQADPKTGLDLWTLQMPERRAVPFLQSEFAERAGRFSPDGRWIAYVSNETGREEVYVRSFPNAAHKMKISTSGGRAPDWGRDGTELFFIDSTNAVVLVPVKTAGSFTAGVPRPLFTTDLSLEPAWASRFAVHGQRFLVVPGPPAVPPPATPITVIVNWPSLLKNRIP